MRGGVHRLGMLVVSTLVAAACTSQSGSVSTGGPPVARPTSDSTTATTSGEPADGASNTAAPPGTACSFEGQPLETAESVEVPVVAERDGLTVRAAVYPRPQYEGNPWSQWGQGIVVDDGRFFSAIGDHIGKDGNSYLYEYDPETKRLSLVADVLSRLDHVPGTWGYGKIHSQMVAGPCGEVYFSTYWGTRRDIEFEGNYSGDVLFRLDPSADTLEPLGVPVERHGQPSLASAPQHGMVYGEAANPLTESGEDTGPFVAYDVVIEEVVYTGPEQPHVGFRSILVDGHGVAYYSIGGGRLKSYDPESGETGTSASVLPGEWLRAATTPADDGSVYGVTREPDRFFAVRPDGSIDALGEALGYTASMALHPDGSVFYHMPGAHGNSAEWDSPVVAVDTTTGEQQTVVELADLVGDALDVTVGGTYNIAVDAAGDTIYVGVNASPAGDDSGFGEVVLVLVELG